MLVDRGSVVFFWLWALLALANAVIFFTVSSFPPITLLVFLMSCVFAFSHYKALREDGRSVIPDKLRRK